MTTSKQQEQPQVSDKTLEEQMDRAEVAVRKARDTTAYLQDQWRSHLFRISFLVLLVSFHQCSTPMQACIHNIKLANNLSEKDNAILGYSAFWFLLSDAMCEVCGNIMVLSLTAFLSLKQPSFSSPFYLLSALLIPIVLTSFFTTSRQIGCRHVLDGVLLEEQVDEVKERDFPVAVVFHAIVTACYFFMQSQMVAREKDIAAIMKLRSDLKEAQARGLTSNNSSSSSASSNYKKKKKKPTNGSSDKKKNK